MLNHETMYTIKKESENAVEVLADLIGMIQSFSDAEDIFQNEIGNNEIQNSTQNRIEVESKGITQSIPGEFFERFGIHASFRYDAPKATVHVPHVDCFPRMAG